MATGAGKIHQFKRRNDRRPLIDQCNQRLPSTLAVTNALHAFGNSRAIVGHQLANAGTTEMPRQHQRSGCRGHGPQTRHQRHLAVGRNHQVECLQIMPQRFGAKDAACGVPRTSYLRRRGARLVTHLHDKGRSHAIDQTIDELRGDDVALQRMCRQQFAAGLEQGRGKVVDQQFMDIVGVGQTRLQECLLERDLGIGQEHRDLRRAETAFLLCPFAEALVVGQRFDGTVPTGGPANPTRTSSSGSFERIATPL
jgi:hypothetical protein